MSDEYYAIVIDTDSYSGNFELEMASFCTGQEFPRGEEYIDKEAVEFDWWTDNSYEVTRDSDCGPEGCSIWPTPGWSNDGLGKHYKLGPGENMKWPAYQSVAIYTYGLPPDEIIESVKKRALEFSDARLAMNKDHPYKSLGSGSDPIVVTGVRLVHIEIKETWEEEVIWTDDSEAA